MTSAPDMPDGVAAVAVRLLHERARLPKRAHENDAGADLYAAESVVIPGGERRDVGTGLALAIPPGYAGFVHGRSGLAFKHGIMVTNAPGLIDSDYRGEVRVSLFNSGTEPFAVEIGDRVAQLVVQAVETPAFQAVGQLDVTERGVGGFGSTG